MLVRSVRVSYGGCGDRRTQPCQQGPIMPDLQSLKGRSASFCDLIATSLYRGVLTICNELDCAHTEHADDTPLPVLAPGTGKTRTTRLWTYVRDERPHAGGTVPAVRYQHSANYRGKHPRDYLGTVPRCAAGRRLKRARWTPRGPGRACFTPRHTFKEIQPMYKSNILWAGRTQNWLT